ncbi:MAG: saccharopine dehydrogenase [Bacteroidetes bacterium]|jgi:saccharopine dehydrogenase-like NADP-dependent oxidoreductase|nr:saccharopine dehydrogenase [Bacteroidota bacterium]MBT4399401.1 saccharopine dehydrogenase [Bacteroidota bacterium]MBT4409800.1 saccharopine dehydrogenase [Bacteroidota bacterium]MBT5424900.1 saccharopine dehydrogenase [Bacteroidota bacterium]MBT7094466.1 saccharopine dehydrogenase [Bacteroidota bacterium]
MKRILVLGAGLSTTRLISYLLEQAESENWHVTVGDSDLKMAEKKISKHKRGKAILFDINKLEEHQEHLINSDLIISMLPARFHPLVAKACLKLEKSMVTASYVSKEISEMDEEARAKGLLFINELGVDPGIDHMSAMRIIDSIKDKGGKPISFKSRTGGLVAPEYDNNPWNYKFTWNPRNVVLAGQGTSRFIRNKRYKHIPYHKLFSRLEYTNIQDVGDFEVYPNRDSLAYRQIYDLLDIPTMVRGTMRRPGFCEAWDVFVQLGLTDDSFIMENSHNMTYCEFVNSFMKYDPETPIEQKLSQYTGIDPEGEIMEKIKWLGLFENEIIGVKNLSPAQILQKKLEEKWILDPDDKDMIVMEHVFEWELKDKKYETRSSLVVKGINQEETAMAITVGTPVGIASKLILNGTIQSSGVKIPVNAAIYNPILDELESLGIKFVDETKEIE